MSIHGGDIYRNEVDMDFSVNVSPYGVPQMVREEVSKATLAITTYPDPYYDELRCAIAESENSNKESIICGNGASELIYASLNALSGIVDVNKKVSMLTPCFLGYEKAAISAGYKNINKVRLSEDDYFLPNQNHINNLLENSSVVILGNPNNPTGRLLNKNWLSNLIELAENNNVYVILDETFLPLTEELDSYDIHSDILIRIRAYTKSMAIPGLRLGYLMCDNKDVCSTINRTLPEWNVSIISERAGVKCAQSRKWLYERVNDSATGLKALRERLCNSLTEAGIEVFNSDTNFILVKSNINLYKELLKYKILIRDCSNFDGLEEGYFRISIKSFEENNKLIEALKNIFFAHENCMSEKKDMLCKDELLINQKDVASKECGSGFEIEIGSKAGSGLLKVNPGEIEKTSFEILTRELKSKGINLSGDKAGIIKRCIHTTADFQYVDTLTFSNNAVSEIKRLIRDGACIVTDTNMALSGINKNELARYGGKAYCFMADSEIAKIAKERGCTRASASMEHASKLFEKTIFVIGNAPTALVTLCEMMDRGEYTPDFVIGVPVGFVNVVQAKEMIISREMNYIVNRGRKGGSNVAAAIVNAILYSMRDE